jgi:hypothetical protein
MRDTSSFCASAPKLGLISHPVRGAFTSQEWTVTARNVERKRVMKPAARGNTGNNAIRYQDAPPRHHFTVAARRRACDAKMAAHGTCAVQTWVVVFSFFSTVQTSRCDSSFRPVIINRSPTRACYRS